MAESISKHQTYEDIQTNGPDESKFKQMVSENPYLADPEREARMREMAEWSDIQGEVTEFKAAKARDAARKVLEITGTTDKDVVAAQVESSRATSWGKHLVEDSGEGNSRRAMHSGSDFVVDEYSNSRGYHNQRTVRSPKTIADQNATVVDKAA